jgi:uncharacterized protein YajQ (UPF0234 family)
MPDNSFDVVSKIELPEVSNAVQQALKEIQQRYDLKNSHSNIDCRRRKTRSSCRAGRVQTEGRHRDPGSWSRQGPVVVWSTAQ